MLSLKGIYKQFNEHTVLDGVDLNLSDLDRVGLIGPNGSGKTTLLRVITGKVKPDEGSVELAHAKIGYLPQELSSKQIAGEYMGESGNQAGRWLKQVGLPISALVLPVAKLSGGQKTRLGLAKLLLEGPNILLLDEPTNNLDIEGLDWLEKFIKTFNGPVLFTSHDRAFLNKVATQIAELSDGRLRTFGGNYDFYKQQMAIEAAAILGDYKAQQKYKQRLLADIAATKGFAKDVEQSTIHFAPRKRAKKVARKAKVRERRLEKQMASEDWIKKPENRRGYSHKLGGTAPNNKLILRCLEVSKKFDRRLIFDDLSLEVMGSQHVWLKGANGSGKSTLLRIIVGKDAADSGEVILGENVRTGYFSQEASQLDLKKTGIHELAEIGLNKTEAMREANRFRIEPSLLNKPLRQLSRGQQTKLEFMKLLFTDYQLIVLDEPTNHLEIETREAIEAALRQYKGAILVASHDRYFLKVIEVDRTIDLDSL